MLRLLFLVIMPQLEATKTSHNIKVYWQSPTAHCLSKHNVPIPVENFDIIANKDHKFLGEKIATFYEYIGKMNGLWPYFEDQDALKPINGGLPQHANVAEHLKVVKKKIEETFTDPNFDGIGILDVEEWRPLYSHNFGEKKVYQEESKKLVMLHHPEFTKEQVLAAAESEFNEAAKDIMVATLQLAKRLRPRALWGFYGFPVCNYDAGKNGEYSCHDKTRERNDQLRWLYEEQTGLFPSPYLDLHKVTRKPMGPDAAMRYIYALLEETKRVQATLPSKLPIYSWTKFEYDPYKVYEPFYSERDLCNSLRQFTDFGIEGILVWSTDSNIGERCGNIADNMAKITGPYLDAVRDRAEFCAESQCSGNGKCIRMPKPTKCDLEYDFSNYKCECDGGWSGAKCDVNGSG